MSDEKKGAAVKSYVDPEQINKDVQINGTDLNNAFLEQSSLLVHYGVQAGRAAHQVDRVKQLQKLAEAQIDKEVREQASDEGRKITESAITAQITAHPKMVQLAKMLSEARLQESLADVAVESLRHRRDMLVQLGAQARTEMQGEIRVAMGEARAAEEKAVRDRLPGKLRGAAGTSGQEAA
ncbi:hypothetical protein F1188_15935 [Roseospira marina]|uniref:Uncharacterized protein n=1 Tax=Roseospira marina TaxID=140057 RepID=A0A5M6I838_9PROT|nr:hypothetical protein [Roseospira marina]KAA5604351.1 hypothetical protein F1188_15935 [Roseospira marina]MBB4315465.1 hypothetical protein [Roseospira marina]MBB5088389.1 hypothetical protein [Roseospira marina]